MINTEDILFTGKGQESDEELRERAKNALISAGKASIVALENALLSLPKVKGVKIREDFSTPDGYGVIDIYIDGPDLTVEEERDSVESTIEAVKAAGIYTRLRTAEQIQLDGTFTIELNPALNLSTAEEDGYKLKVQQTIEDLIDQLDIGEPLIFTKLIMEVLLVEGVDNLDNIQITTEDTGGGLQNYAFQDKKIVIGETQRLVPRAITIDFPTP